jgi:signal transduction histidine kinase/CheY-like chemotaxis protein
VKVTSRLSRAAGRILHELRLRGPLAADPTAQMLHALLLIVTIWMAVALLVTGKLISWPVRRVLTYGTVQVGLISSLTLIRLGYCRVSSLVYLTSTWIYATLAVSAMGGIRSPIIILYGTLPVSAAWLLGYEAALWAAGACIGTMLVFAVLETIGMSPPNTLSGTALGMWFIAVQATLIGTVPVGQVIRRLLATLKELDEYKQHLERLVEERTAELARACDEAQAANRAKSVFLANMSHELRTPLNAILGFSHLLRERGASEKQRHELDIINRSGEHLLSLINDVLDVAKIEAGRSELEIAPFNLGTLIEDVTNMIQPRTAQKGLALRVETPQVPLFIRTDAARLRQVLINLLNNAVKFTEQGSVTLRVSAIPANKAGEVLLTFEIEDTDEGIATADQGRIFDAFVQTSAAKHHEGAGLGLTIAHQIIKLMEGTIHVESTPGRGSRFRLEIRVERVQVYEAGDVPEFERVTALAEGQQEYRILIVEDQRENWMVLEQLLQNAGFRVRVAENGAQGLKEFREWRPHFIWMDLRMPGMDGLESTRRIRACDGGREVKIAAVTASGYASERSGILDQGLDDCVRKPYRPAEIFECMARHLGVRYQGGEALRVSGEGTGSLAPEDLQALPDELRGELRNALMALDPARILSVIERVSLQNAALG